MDHVLLLQTEEEDIKMIKYFKRLSFSLASVGLGEPPKNNGKNFTLCMELKGADLIFDNFLAIKKFAKIHLQSIT